MVHRIRFVEIFTAILLLGMLTPAAAADEDRDRTQVGHNINIGPNEQVSEATCFGCSIRIRGHVEGDVTTFGGRIVVEDQGEIGGDATSFGGEIRLGQQAKVGGDVSAFGAHVRRSPEASVGGSVTDMSGPGWLLLIFVLPLVMLGAVLALIVWLVWRLVHRRAVPIAA